MDRADYPADGDEKQSKSSCRGAALAARYRDAIRRFIGGDSQLRDALVLVMQDRANQPGPPSMATYQEYLTRALR